MNGIVKKSRTLKSVSISENAFENTQLNLFQNFLCNTKEERNELSNCIDLWDSIPRYSVSQQAQNKMRSKEGTLKPLKIDFSYKGKQCAITIMPAKIENSDGQVMEYYPSANEEIVEDALRKIAAEQNKGFFDNNKYKSGVVFSLYILSEELKKRGHNRSYLEIKKSLEILARSTIDISCDNNDLEVIATSSYFPSMIRSSKKKLQEDPEAKWVIQFHPLVTKSIDQVTYRQYNYHQMMTHKTQLARWLHKQLSLKYTFANIANQFQIHFTTIFRDSALLNSYKLKRQAIQAVDKAFLELEEKKIITNIEKEEIKGIKNKLEDVIYTVKPSIEFVQEIKAANKRLKIIRDQFDQNLLFKD